MTALRTYTDVEPTMGGPGSRDAERRASAWDTGVFDHHWTEADLDGLPDDGHRYEIIDGNLIVTPAPILRHQRLGLSLIRVLEATAPEGWRTCYDVGIRVPAGCLIPDVVVLRPGVDLDTSWQEPGDVGLVVEIASPSTETRDQGDKLVAYARAGIPAYWRVARDGTVTVHQLADNGAYGTAATVKPGETWSTDAPFPVTVDPAALLEDL